MIIIRLLTYTKKSYFLNSESFFSFFFLGNTSSFLTHIDVMHPNDPAASTPNTLSQKPVQPKLSFEKQHNMNDRKVAVDDQLMKLIVGKVLQTSLVENEHLH